VINIGYNTYNSAFVDNIVNYTNKPASSDVVHPNGMEILLPDSTQLVAIGAQNYNDFNEEIVGATGADLANICNMSLAHDYSSGYSVPDTGYERSRYVWTYGYRLFCMLQTPSYPYEPNTVEVKCTLRDWGYECD
jgi:hypothetical protein